MNNEPACSYLVAFLTAFFATFFTFLTVFLTTFLAFSLISFFITISVYKINRQKLSVFKNHLSNIGKLISLWYLETSQL